MVDERKCQLIPVAASLAVTISAPRDACTARTLVGVKLAAI